MRKPVSANGLRPHLCPYRGRLAGLLWRQQRLRLMNAWHVFSVCWLCLILVAAKVLHHCRVFSDLSWICLILVAAKAKVVICILYTRHCRKPCLELSQLYRSFGTKAALLTCYGMLLRRCRALDWRIPSSALWVCSNPMFQDFGSLDLVMTSMSSRQRFNR